MRHVGFTSVVEKFFVHVRPENTANLNYDIKKDSQSHPLAKISSATFFLTWFILQTVTAGKGMLLRSASKGLKLIITGLDCHLL